MAEPSIKDVLSALSKMEARLETKIDAVHVDLVEKLEALDGKVEVVRGVLESTRRDTRDLREDVTAIHKGLARVVPKDLPSQVRAKNERPTRPAKGTARRR